MIKSPLNYTGGKYKLLPQILPLFPKDIDTFVDLFAGGFNVGINVEANKIICNDHIDYLIDLYEYFQVTNIENIIKNIKLNINSYQLSLTNNEGYLNLRKDYNDNKDIIKFFVLICYSFNHQIRFNQKQEFNMPFGKNRSQYNSNIERNLINFVERIQNSNIKFTNNSFVDFNFTGLNDNDLIYCDPPYLISTASYNEQNGWTEKEERQLLSLLDELNSKDIRFALSNVLYHKGMSNELLIEWSKKYNVYYLDKHYKNCNYHLKDKDNKTVEVLITNY